MDAGIRLEVVVGVLRQGADTVLICKRPAHLDHGSLWEFPGGKREPGESRTSALTRELAEEIGVSVRAAYPFLRIEHDYAHRGVALDVWMVTSWIGEVYGKEAQPIRWVNKAQLRDYQFPAANVAIIEKLLGLPVDVGKM